jgi:hypothetical protein
MICCVPDRPPVRSGAPGSEIANLVAHGFIEVGPGANGHDSLARCTG